MNKPFEAPNHTQFSNDAIDYIMREVSPNAWKIITVAIRKTYGWHKQSDVISLSQFQELTGIGSRSTLVSAIKEAVDKKILIKKENGISFEYELNREYIVQKSDQYRNCTDTSTETVLVGSTETVHTKENNKEKEYKPNLKEAKERIAKQREERAARDPVMAQLTPEIKMLQEMRIRVEAATGLGLSREWDKPRSSWNGYEKILIKREMETGQTIEKFMEWYNSDDFRKNGVIWLTADKIELWWSKAFSEKTESYGHAL